MTDAPGPTHVDFRLLGPLGVTANGQPLVLPGAAERALLALLLLSPGRTVTSNALIDRLWGEALPADPSNALQLRVSKLRRALAGTDAAVVRDGVGYRAKVAPESVDVEAFISGVNAARSAGQGDDADVDAAGLYGAALGRWAGEPLADFADQPWATVEAARLSHRIPGDSDGEAAMVMWLCHGCGQLVGMHLSANWVSALRDLGVQLVDADTPTRDRSTPSGRPVAPGSPRTTC